MRNRDKTTEQLHHQLSEYRRWLGELKIPEARLKLALQAIEESGGDCSVLERDLPDPFFLFDDKFRIVSCNKPCSELLGYGKSDLESMTVREIQESDESFIAFQQTADFPVGDQPFRKTEWRFLRKDGAVFTAEMVLSPVPGGLDSGRRNLVVIRDLSTSKKTEGVLLDSEAQHRSILDSIEEGYFEVNLAGTLTYFNDSFCLIAERESKKLLGLNYHEYTTPEVAKTLYSFFNEIYKTGQPVKLIEYEIISGQGEPRIHQLSASLMRDQDGNPAGFRGIVRDVTARKRAEEALKESEKKYRLLFESATDAIFLMEKGRFVDCNPTTLIMFDCAREDIIDKTPDVFSPPTQPDGEDSSQRAARKIHLALDGHPQFFEWRHCRGDGTEFDTEVSLNRFEISGRMYLLAIVRDVTARKRAEEALKESELRFRSIFDLCPEAIALSDAHTGRLIDVNEKLCELTKFKRHEIIGRSTVEVELYSVDDRRRFIEELQTKGEVHGLEMDFKAKDGSILNVLIFSRIIQVRGRSFIFNIFLDMTERKQLEVQLQHAQKMKAITTLAGGIAHEFNNALAGLSGNLELLEIVLPSDPYMQNRAEAMKASIRRMVNLTNQLTAYAKGGEYQPKGISLGDAVVDVLAKMQHSIHPAIRIEKHFAPNACYVQADSVQIQMVVSAILNNALEALNGDGRIRISTMDVEIDEVSADNYPELNPGRYGCLIIEDNGVGMSEETRSRIFDPFYSTKFQGRGLGMAAVYGIIKNHGGWLSVDSEPGKGSIVSMYLPAVESQE